MVVEKKNKKKERTPKHTPWSGIEVKEKNKASPDSNDRDRNGNR